MTYEPTKEEIEAAVAALAAYVFSDQDLDRCAHFCQIEAMKAALRAAAKVRGDGWRPIESAPKDGSFILVYRPLAGKSNDPVVALKRGVDYNNHCWECTVPEGKEPLNYTDGSCFPTHWMPLPTPPEEL